MLYQYKIADLVLNIEDEDRIIDESLNKFLVKPQGKADLSVTLKGVNTISFPKGSSIAQGTVSWMKKTEGSDGYYLHFIEEKSQQILILAEVDSIFTHVILTYIKTRDSKLSEWGGIQRLIFYMIGMIFRYSILFNNGLILHASAIECKGKGILFSAPSGTGKSTYARLWQMYIGDDVIILNDDAPAVIMKEGKTYVCGTPWSGSSDIHSNGLAPLSAIIILEQASENKIRKLGIQEIVSRLLPRVGLPSFDRRLIDDTMYIFEKIIADVPIYLLSCRPDKEAVDLVYQSII